MIYLLDTSCLVRLLRDPRLQSAWYDAIDAGAIASCYVQRTEFLDSARNGRQYDEIMEMFTDLYPDVSVLKNAGRWIGAVRYCMVRAGRTAAHRRSTWSSPRPRLTTASPSSTTTPTTVPLPGTHPA